jgi:hypothetical protein
MPSPRCETCPWWTRKSDTYSCHHHETAAPEPTPSWWCSLHPDAPQPVYEVWKNSGRTPRDRPGWEPVVGEVHNTMSVLWRRITGYTKGGE